MDQATLQRVTLARPSGTLCGTARGAREQQRLRTWIECPFSESVASSWPTRCWTPWLRQCNALQVWYWDEEAWEAPEQFCRIFSNWAPCNYARLKFCLPIAAAGWSCHNVLLTRHFATGLSPLQPGTSFMAAQWWMWCVTDVDWSPTLPYVTVPDAATELLPGRGAVLLQVSC